MRGAPADDSLEERLTKADRAIQRANLEERIRALGGIIGRPAGKGEEATDIELGFLNYVMAWETATFSTHGEWLARHGLVFDPPEELGGQKLRKELRRLIESLAVARLFLYHTNHLSDVELYVHLWHEVLDGGAPDFARTPDDACHWDFAEGGTAGENCWLTYYATDKERRKWLADFPDTILPVRQRPPYRRDHQMPQRD